MKIKKVFDLRIVVIIPMIVALTIFVIKLFTDFDTYGDKFASIGILIAIILGQLIRDYFETMKHFIELTENELSISDSIHGITVNIEMARNVKYENHNLFLDYNGLKYSFNLYGYDRKKIEKLIETIKTDKW